MNYFKVYGNFLKDFSKLQKPIKVVFDCSNGSAGRILKNFLPHPNLKTILINDLPDGHFPAHDPNPLARGAVKQLSATVIKEKADLGVIFDEDGDRVIFIDNLGRLFPSYLAARILFLETGGPVVFDSLISQSLKISGFLYENANISKVGSIFMKKKIFDKKARFGAEYSGHYYFNIRGCLSRTL